MAESFGAEGKSMTNGAPGEEAVVEDTIESVEAPLGVMPGHLARIGLIALSSGYTSEQELHAMLPAGTLVLTSRVANSNTIDLEHLAAMESELARAAATLLPEGHLDVMIYSCTSGTIAMGEQTVFDRIHDVRPGIAVTTPFTGAVAALTKLGAGTVLMLTPYSHAVTGAMRDEIRRRGVEVVRTLAMGLERDSEMCRVTPRSVLELGAAADHPAAQALFISCTALTTSPIIDALEQRLGKPVVTSNQALAWHALRLAGYEAPLDRFGKLMRL